MPLRRGFNRPNLVEQLRSILDQYPDDNQILKELIQNAEDAGATEVIFLYDKTSYGKQKILNSKVADFQGPALYAYNNAEFTADDWEGISTIHKSNKRKDAMKVGRFGLGFKSVFHMTDVVGILSGEQLGYLDPSKRCFSEECFGWSLENKELSNLVDQIETFKNKVFNFQFPSISYPGTIFRFPFRDKPSPLSETSYNEHKVMQLFEMFKYEAHYFLMFLSKIEKISIYIKDENSETKLHYSVHINDSDLQKVHEARQSFHSPLRNIESWLPSPHYVTFTMSTTDTNGKSQDWLITHYFEGGYDKSLQEIYEKDKNKYLPWVGICLPLDSKCADDPNGQVFCFMPLPIEEKSAAGFHFHVHGYFAVDQNRRHLKWPSADQDKHELGDDLKWNYALLKEALPNALRVMVLHCINEPSLLDASSVYALFPDPSRITSHWLELSHSFYEMIKNDAIFWTEGGVQRWVKFHQAMIMDKMEDTNDVIEKVLTQSSRECYLSKPPLHVLTCVSNKPKQVTQSYLGPFAREFDMGRLTREEKQLLTKYMSVTEDGIEILNNLCLVETETGEYKSFAEECFLDVNEYGFPMTMLLPGLKFLFHKAVLTTDWYFDVLKSIASSGNTGLKANTRHDLPPLLRRMFKQTDEEIQLDKPVCLENDHFVLSHEWYTQIWKFIDENEMEKYEGLTILRSGDKLLKLTTSMPYLYESVEADNEIMHLAKAVGCIIVSHTPIRLDKYVYPCSAEGLLLAMKSIPDVALKIEQEDPIVKSKLKNYLTQVDLADSEKFIRSLPLFETIATENEKSVWMNLTEITTALVIRDPTSVPLLPTGVRIAQAKAENSENVLVKNLGVKCVTDTELYVGYVLPNFESYLEPNRRKILDDIMSEFDHHMKNTDFIASLQEVKCLESTINPGTFVFPKEVFDHEDEEIHNMFQLSDILPYPPNKYQSKLMRTRLQLLGISGVNNLTALHLLKLARYIDRRADKTCSNQLLTQSKKLCEYLKKHYEILQKSVNVKNSMKRLHEAICDLRFIPVEKQRPLDYDQEIPWKGETIALASPRQGATDYKLIGSQAPVFSLRYSSLAHCYRWNEWIKVSDVILHLKCIIDSSKNKLESNDQKQSMLLVIYKFLNQHMSQEVVELLNDLKTWIWNGSFFIEPTCAMFDFELRMLNLAPHMFILPPLWQQYDKLFCPENVRYTMDPLDVLWKIRESHLKNVFGDDDHQLVLAIVQHVTMLVEKGSIGHEVVEQNMLVPIKTKTSSVLLELACKCTYMNVDLEDFGDMEDDEMYILHSDISEANARTLNIPNFMSRYIDSDEISFGQTEKLTSRLRNILSEYKDGSAVFKELIQNADDAGASEVAIIYDRRDFRHESTPLLDENMRGLQGPAILAYNDARFSESDYENIVKLSGATKESETAKIGRFGLGFNAVYHLTDVPCFVSGENIVYFDPHVKYLEKCILNKSKPGVKLNQVKHAKKLHKFHGQFKPFLGLPYPLQKGWSLEEEFHGTLFRFPLRTKDQSDESLISTKTYSHDQVVSLLRLLEEEANDLLLFTQNVKTIKVSMLENNVQDAKPVMLFQIHREIQRILQSITPDNEGQLNQQTSTTLNAKENQTRILHMAQSMSSQTKTVSNCYVLDIHFSRGNQPDAQTQWLICNYVANREDIPSSVDVKYLLPVAGLAAKLFQVSSDSKYLCKPLSTEESKLFCFLPLPIQKGLPTHVNAYFAITSSRTHLHERENRIIIDSQASWNEFLMENVVCQAYITLFKLLIANPAYFDHAHLRENIFKLFPITEYSTNSHKSESLHALMTAFLQEAFVAQTCNIFPGERSWILKPYKSLDKKMNDNENRKLFARICNCILNKNKDGEIFTLFPSSVYESIDVCSFTSKVDSHFLTMLEMYREVFLPNIEQFQIADVKVLLLYGFEYFKDIENVFSDIPCVPVYSTTNEHQYSFKTAAEVVMFPCDISDLYNNDEEMFPLPLLEKTTTKICREKWIAGLSKLGMRYEMLTNEEIIDRMEQNRSQNADKAIKRCDILLNLLLKLDSYRIQEIRSRAIEIHFIPPLCKPSSWMLPWKSDESMTFFTLQQVLDTNDYSFLGSVLNIPTHFHQYEAIHMKFGLKSVTAAESVVEQILLMSSVVGVVNGLERSVRDCIENIAEKCYKWCDSNAEALTHINELEKMPLIWIYQRATFVSGTVCALKTSPDYHPYLHQTPYKMLRYKKLLKALTVRESFDCGDFIGALRSCHEEYTDVSVGQENQLAVLNLISGLSDCLQGKSVSEVIESYGQIFLLNKMGKFKPSTELSINTTTWLPDENDDVMCHSKIPPVHADLLGVRTMQNATLDKFRCPMMAQFGQREKLTNRINHILESYPSNKEILKEMLQNANDAGATEVHFVLDKRNHGTSRIFSESWKHLQGPALLLFNDKNFTEKDIVGIQDLGAGSKSDNASMTGKFGVGFNCVYHLTDTPTFATNVGGSNNILCVFDPQCKYCPGADTLNPGGMWSVNDELKNKFSDVFHCYNIEEFQREEYSLFRFPLRTNDIAKTSLFSPKEVTVNEITDMFKAFKEYLPPALLFLANIRKVKLSNINDNDNVFETVFEITTSITQNPLEHDAYFAAVQHASKRNESFCEVPVMQAEYEMTILQKNRNSQTWLISQRLGLESPERVNSALREQYAEYNACLLPRGGVAYRIDTGVYDQTEQPMNHKDLEHSQKDSEPQSVNFSDARYRNLARHKDRELCFLYCTLPLPVSSYFPVHVNGDFALDNETRHDIFQSETRYPFKNDWNEFIFKELVAKAYIRLIFRLKKKISSLPARFEDIAQDLDTFVQALPINKLCDMRKLVQPAQISFLKELIQTDESIFPIVERQIPQESCKEFPQGEVTKVTWRKAFDSESLFYWIDETHNDAKERRGCSIELFNVFFNLKLPITWLPFCIQTIIKESVEIESAISENISSTKPLFLFVCPESALRHLQKYKGTEKTLETPISVEISPFLNVNNVVLMFSFVSKSEESKTSWSGLPLVVTMDGILRKCDSTYLLIATSFTQVFPKCAYKLLHVKFFLNFEHKCKLLAKEFADFITRMDISTAAQLLTEQVGEVLFSKNTVKCRKNVMPWLGMFYNFLDYELFTELNLTKTVEIRQAMRALEDWCLIPVVQNEKHYLTAIKTARSILFPSNSELYSNALKYMQFTKVSNHAEKASMMTVLRRLVLQEQTPWELLDLLNSELHDVDNFLSCHVKKVYTFELQNNPPSDVLYRKCVEVAECILKYFATSIEEEQPFDKATRLRQLPFYIDCNQRLCTLTNTNVIVIARNVVCKNFDCINISNTVFLRSDIHLDTLYKYIGAVCYNYEETYIKVILPNIQNLPEQAIEEQVEILKSHINKLESIVGRSQWLLERKWSKLSATQKEDKQQIQVKQRFVNDMYALLNHVRFIRKKDGNLYSASEFYDPDIELLKIMECDSDILPEKFNGSAWKRFIIKLGLQTEPTDTMLINYATKLESSIKPDYVRTAAQVLLKYVNSKEKFIYLLSRLSGIRFIPRHEPPQRLKKMCAPFESQPLVSFRECVKLSYEKFTWTTFPTMEHWNEPSVGEFDKWHMNKFTLQHLLANMKNVVISLRANNELKQMIGEIQDLMVDHLQHAHTHFGMEAEDKTFLQGIPCVLSDAGKFYRPDQVVRAIDNEWNSLGTTFCILPDNYVPTVPILTDLGMTTEITLDKTLQALFEMREKYKGEDLAEHDKSFAILLTKLFFVLLEEIEHLDISSLFLLSAAHTMENSHELCFVDDTSIVARGIDASIKQLYPLEKGDLGRKIPRQVLLRLFSKLPEHCRPSLLTSFMCEKVDEQSYLGETNVPIASHIEDTLHSPELRHSLLRIIKHDITKSSDCIQDVAMLSSLEEILHDIKCIGLLRLSTYLVQHGSRIDKSDKSKTIFVTNSNTNHHTVYVTPKVQKNTLCIKIANIILSVSKPCSESQHVPLYLPALLATDVSEMSMFLDEMNIAPYGSNISIQDHRDVLGMYLPKEYVAALDPFPTTFEPLDLVAVEIYDPILEWKNHESKIGQKCLDPSFCVAKVHRSLSNDKCHHYEVELNNGKKEIIMSSRLYKLTKNYQSVNAQDSAPEEQLESWIRSKLAALEYTTSKGDIKAMFKRLLLQLLARSGKDHMSECYQRIVVLKNEVAHHLKRSLTNKGSTAEAVIVFTGSKELENEMKMLNLAIPMLKSRSDKYRVLHSDHELPNITEKLSKYSLAATVSLGSERMPNPQHSLSILWIQRAQYDLRQVNRDMQNSAESYHWACFKCHQACEKALYAVQLSIDASYDQIQHHNLQTVNSVELSIKMKTLLGTQEDLMSPHKERYTKDVAFQANEVAVKIVEQCNDSISKMLTEKQECDKKPTSKDTIPSAAHEHAACSQVSSTCMTEEKVTVSSDDDL